MIIMTLVLHVCLLSILEAILVSLKECTREVKSGKWRHIFCCKQGSHHDIAGKVLVMITITKTLVLKITTMENNFFCGRKGSVIFSAGIPHLGVTCTREDAATGIGFRT